MNRFYFIKGEVRKITYELTCKHDKNFSISAANVDIIKNYNVIKNVGVQLNEHTIEFIVDTNDLSTGNYKIMITCHINEEVIKKIAVMEVRD